MSQLSTRPVRVPPRELPKSYPQLLAEVDCALEDAKLLDLDLTASPPSTERPVGCVHERKPLFPLPTRQLMDLCKTVLQIDRSKCEPGAEPPQSMLNMYASTVSGHLQSLIHRFEQGGPLVRGATWIERLSQRVSVKWRDEIEDNLDLKGYESVEISIERDKLLSPEEKENLLQIGKAICEERVALGWKTPATAKAAVECYEDQLALFARWRVWRDDVHRKIEAKRDIARGNQTDSTYLNLGATGSGAVSAAISARTAKRYDI